jgi:hypothetical protein
LKRRKVVVAMQASRKRTQRRSHSHSHSHSSGDKRREMAEVEAIAEGGRLMVCEERRKE